MSVVDLHPEDLIDKWSDGCLSAAEHERLVAHVVQCAGCRFELGVRPDFADVARELPFVGLTRGAAAPRSSSPDIVVPVASRRARRGRRAVWLLALSAALVGSVSLAAFVARVARNPVSVTAPSRAPAIATAGGAKAPVAIGDSTPAPHPVALGDLPLPEPMAGHAPRAGAETDGPGAPAHAMVAESVVGSRKALTASALFQSANQARRDGNAPRAISLYRTLEAEYPRSAEARLSYATLARLLLDRGDARSALEGFDQYLSKGDVALGEEALVGRALSLQKLGSRDAEAAAWRDVLARFPKSVHARLARSRLADLGAP